MVLSQFLGDARMIKQGETIILYLQRQSMLLIAHQKGTKPKSIKKQKPLRVEEFGGDPEDLWRTIRREATESDVHSSKVAWAASLWVTWV